MKKLNDLLLKDIEATLIICFETLETLGIKQQFLYLFERVGIPAEFFLILNQNASYADPTREFLASVKLTPSNFVEFQINGQMNSVSLEQMREWFHLPEPNMKYFGYEEPVNGRDPGSKIKF